MMEIFKADFEDLNKILELQYLAYQSEAALFGTNDIPLLKQTLEEVIQEYRNGIILKMISENNDIIGSVRAREDNGTAYIGKLMVHQDYRGRGYGTKLLSEIEKYYPQKRYELFTSTRSEANIRLYQRNGYRIFDRKSVNDDLVFVYMEKNSSLYKVRCLSENEIPAALELAWKVFSEYESPDYAPEGTEEFHRCLHDEEYLEGIEYYGTFDGKKLIGIIGIRADKNHICFFFVDGYYHRRGIGTSMFRYLLKDYSGKTITLNASPYGVPFYKAIGFVPTDEEKTVNGIRFTPMEYRTERGRL